MHHTGVHVAAGCPTFCDGKIVNQEVFENITIFLINNVSFYGLLTRYQAFSWLLSIRFLLHLCTLTILTVCKNILEFAGWKTLGVTASSFSFTSCNAG